jgi:hypothetical protein
VRGGLDDALEKLARRDELRRRAAGEAMGTPPPVQDLVEAIAAVVSRNPALAVTVGVEGAGDPVLLHFAVEDGIVRVSADNTVASRVAEAAPTSPRHADYDIDLADSVEESYPHSAAPASETGQATRRISYDDTPAAPYQSSTYADGPFANHRQPEKPGPFDQPDPFDGMQARPFADGPPHRFGRPASPFTSEATRRIHTQHHPTAGEAATSERMPNHRLAEQHVMPTPLPEPVPLKVDTAETELAAKRLAALLRDNPTLLRRAPSD